MGCVCFDGNIIHRGGVPLKLVSGAYPSLHMRVFITGGSDPDSINKPILNTTGLVHAGFVRYICGGLSGELEKLQYSDVSKGKI